MTAGYQESQSVQSNMGSIRISGDVIRLIAGITFKDVLGVVGINGNSIAPSDHKNLTHGIKTELAGNLVTISLQIWVEYGFNIPDVALQIQTVVKKTVEEMTGLTVVAVNVTVEGVSFIKET